MDDEQPISFVGTTSSDDSTEKVIEFDESGTITGAKVVTHRGQEYALRSYATLIRNGSETPLWMPLDEAYLAGDGQTYDLPVRMDFEEDDKLVLRAENVNQGGNEYHHNMTISIDYEGVVERYANRLKRRLSNDAR